MLLALWSKLVAWLAVGEPPHWLVITKWIVGVMPFVLLSIANALTKYYAEKTGLRRFVLFWLDVFSFLASRGSPQTLKMPGLVSTPPVDAEKKPDDDGPPTFLPGGGLQLVATLLVVIRATAFACMVTMVVALALLLPSGCAPGITAAYQTVATVATVHQRGSAIFDKFDKGQQEKILATAKDRKDPDGGEGALRSYHAKQAKVLAVFGKAEGTVLAAEASLPLIKLGVEKQKTPAAWIATLLGQMAAMVAALTELGVPGLDALAKPAEAPKPTSWRMSPDAQMSIAAGIDQSTLDGICSITDTNGSHPCGFFPKGAR